MLNADVSNSRCMYQNDQVLHCVVQAAEDSLNVLAVFLYIGNTFILFFKYCVGMKLSLRKLL
jgi:hypothetical protein